MLSIQTNVTSLFAQQALDTNAAFESKTIQQLSSGYRINSSGDDAAGTPGKFPATTALRNVSTVFSSGSKRTCRQTKNAMARTTSTPRMMKRGSSTVPVG